MKHSINLQIKVETTLVKMGRADVSPEAIIKYWKDNPPPDEPWEMLVRNTVDLILTPIPHKHRRKLTPVLTYKAGPNEPAIVLVMR